MSIKTTFFVIFATLVGLLVSLVLITSLAARNQRAVAASEHRRYESYKLADELRQSSDDLTRMARTYVVTGDPIYEQYFHDILAIRNGEKPRPENYSGIYWDFVAATGETSIPGGRTMSLEYLMRDMRFTDDEFRKLKEAQNRSDALVRLETVAMNAVKGKFDDGTGHFTLQKAPDLALAQRLMHGAEYHVAKARIMEPINEFFQLLEDRTGRELQILQRRGRLYTQIELALTGIAALFALGAFVLVQRRVLTPVHALVTEAQRVEQGDYSQRVIIRTSDEMGILSQAFNNMVESLQYDIAARQRTEAELRQREQEFRHLIEHSPVPLVVTTLERTQYVNPKFTDVFGYTLDDIPTPDAWAEQAYLDPVYRQEVMARWRARFTETVQTQSEFQTHHEIRVTCKNGELRNIVITSTTIGVQHLVALYDITGIKRAEDALRQSEEKFRRIVEGLKDEYVFYSINADDVLTYLSPSVETVLGYTQEEVYTNNYTAYLTDNPINVEAAHIYQEEFATGQSVPPYETIVRTVLSEG